MIRPIRNNTRNFLLLVAGVASLYLATCLWAHNTQVAIYSQDIPPNMICVKDTFPNAYLCITDQDVPWFLSKEGELSNVKQT